MHEVDVVTLLTVLTLVGVEFSVSAFVHPAAHHLDPEAQRTVLGRLALVLGKVMPVWYPLCALLLGVETWLHWRAGGHDLLLAADAIWVLTSLASIFLLVPLNTRIAQGAADWQQLHQLWDKRHRVRIAALAAAAVLLTSAIAR